MSIELILGAITVLLPVCGAYVADRVNQVRHIGRMKEDLGKDLTDLKENIGRELTDVKVAQAASTAKLDLLLDHIGGPNNVIPIHVPGGATGTTRKATAQDH